MKNKNWASFVVLAIAIFLLLWLRGVNEPIAGEAAETLSVLPVLEEEGPCIPEVIQNKLQVKYKTKQQYQIAEAETIIEGTKASTVFNSNKNIELKQKKGLDRWVEVDLPKNVDLETAIKKYRSNPNVEEVSKVYTTCFEVIPNDDRMHQQWHLNNSGSSPPNALPGEDIDAFRAWDLEKGSVVIGNPDTSVFWYHPDLVNNIWKNLGEDADGDGIVIFENGTEIIDYIDLSGNPAQRTIARWSFDPDDINNIDDDNNGYVDDFIGWDFRDNDNDPKDFTSSSDDLKRHGTTTTGMITATTNNSFGFAGACWNCSVIASRGVGGSNPEAIVYAADMGAKAITMSWYYPYEGAVKDAIDYAYDLGVVLVAAAGNSGDTQVNPLCDTEKVICVSGTTHTGARWGDSVFGENVDIGAPSSTFTTSNAEHPYFPFVFSWGTSLASPLVAGVAGLVASKNPDLNPAEIKSILHSSTEPFMYNNVFGGVGRINAYFALQLAEESLNYGSFPVALIDSNNSYLQGNMIILLGTATSPDFLGFEIQIADGLYGNNFNTLYSRASPVSGSTLFGFDISNYDPGYYTVKLISRDINGQEAYDLTYFLKNDGLPYQPFWPRTYDDTVIYANVDYIDSDNYMDLIISDGSNINKYNSWFKTATLNAPSMNLISIADIVGDSKKEVFYPSTTGLMILDENFSIIANLTDNIYISSSAAQVDGVGKNELIVQGFNFSVGQIFINVLDENLNSLPGWPKGLPIMELPRITAGDLNGDYKAEIVTINNKQAKIYSDKGQLVRSISVPGGIGMQPSISLGDLNNNLVGDLLISNLTHTFAFDYNGNILPGWPVAKTGYVTLTDFDGDSFLEVIIGGDSLSIFDYQGNSIMSIVAPDTIMAPVSTGDINGDSIAELLAVSRGKIYAFTTTGTLLTGWPQDTTSIPYTSDPHSSSPFVEDFDGDGQAEILYGYQDYYIWRTNTPYSNVRGWNGYLNDEKNSGYYHSSAICGDNLCELGESCSTCGQDCACDTCAYNDNPACLLEASCDWCSICEPGGNKTNQQSQDYCADLGTCVYECVAGSCGAECSQNQVTTINTCIDSITLEVNTSTCTDSCTYNTVSSYVDCSASGNICVNGECVVNVDCSAISFFISCATTPGNQCEWCDDCSGGSICSNTGTCPVCNANEYDLNGDTIVNIDDLILLILEFRTNNGEVGFVSEYDFNTDGYINILDLVLLASNLTVP